MDAIDWSAAKVWLDLAQWAFAGGVAVYAWWNIRTGESKKTIAELREGIDGVDKKIDDKIDPVEVELKDQIKVVEKSAVDAHSRITSHNDRMNYMQKEIDGSPSHRDIQAVKDQLGEVSREISKVSGSLTGIERVVGMVNDYLMNHKG